MLRRSEDDHLVALVRQLFREALRAQDEGARRVDALEALGLALGAHLRRNPVCADDDDAVCCLGRILDDLDAKCAQSLADLGVMDDLPEIVDGPAGLGGGLGQLDRFLDPETEPVLAREKDFHDIKCTGRLSVHTPLLGRKKRRDATHDRVGHGLRIFGRDAEVARAEWLADAHVDVAAPERSEPRAAGATDRERDDRCARMLCDVRHAGTTADELAALAAMALRKEAERLPRGDDRERHLQRSAIRLAAPHRERADGAQEEPDDRRLEELALPHVPNRAAERELDPRRVLPIDMVRDEDVATAPRDVLGAFEAPRRKECRESANDRKSDSPEPQPLFGEDRGSGNGAQDRVTCITRSSASPTERPSVSTSIATLAALSGATARSLSSSSRRRISVRRACRERFSPRAASSSSRRRARSAADAVRNTLRSASGSTTVPISRPTITIRPRFAISRCCSTIASRTCGMRAT